MIDFVQALILGLVEGLTEFLPISSTAHLMLVSEILGLGQGDFVKTFEIAIQGGAILAVLIIYWKRLIEPQIFKRIVMAFLPTAVIGLILYKIIKVYLIGNIALSLWALALGGLIIIVFEVFFDKPAKVGKIEEMNYKTAFYIGVAQAVAVVPGVSRSAATIVGGLVGGLSREAIVEFSFLLAVPTILAATALDIFKNYTLFSAGEFGILSVGFVSSFIFALIGIKFLLGFIRKHSFVSFGVYRIILAVVFLAFFL